MMACSREYENLLNTIKGDRGTVRNLIGQKLGVHNAWYDIHQILSFRVISGSGKTSLMRVDPESIQDWNGGPVR